LHHQGRHKCSGPASPKFDNEFLKQFPSFLDFVKKSQPGEAVAQEVAKGAGTPEEILGSSYQNLRDALADELLERVKACSSQFFERLVVELLVAMGYGGSEPKAGRNRA
jgi:restriction system protein